MPISMHIRCNSCKKDFHTVVHDSIRLKDLPDTCMPCWDRIVIKEVAAKELAMRYTTSKWKWDDDTFSFDDVEDTVPKLPAVGTSIIPVNKNTVSIPPPVVDPISSALEKRVENLILALRANKAY